MKKIFILAILFYSTVNMFAQKYQPFKSQDGVDFSNAWLKPGFTEGKPVELLFKIKNNNKYAVLLTYSVDYYLNGELKESVELYYCLKAKKTATGKLNGLFFISEKLTNEQILSKGFKWELNDLKVKEVTDCTKYK